MKVLIFNNYGGIVPALIKPFVKAKEVSWRTGDIVKFVETLAVNNLGMDPRSIKTKVVVFEDNDKSKTYLFNDENVTCKIVNVDTKRPWTIMRYDGGEYIQYLDYKCKDLKLNYCELLD